MKITFWVQLIIAAIIFALGWSHTSSLMFGRTPSFPDIVALSAPLLLVLLFWWGAARLWGQEKFEMARLLSLTPLIAALLLAYFVGMV